MINRKAVSLTRQGVDYEAEWKAKSDLGTRVHACAESYARDEDDWDRHALPEDEPYLEAFLHFWWDEAIEPLLVEPIVVYPVEGLEFGGRPDLIATRQGGTGTTKFRERAIFDYKTGSHFMVDPVMQLEAYSRCKEAVYEGEWLTGWKDLPILQARYIVYLNSNGTYNLIPTPGGNLPWRTFMALRQVYSGVKSLEAWERKMKKELA